MVAQIPLIPEPYPDPLSQTSEEFEISAVQTSAALNPYAKGANQLALEVNEMALNTEAAAGAAANAKWAAGTYAQGAIAWSPIDFMDYRCKVAGVRNTDPALDPTNWAIRMKTSVGGSDTTISAVDIALTSSSGRLQIISMSAASKKVTLPSAGTLQKGTPLYVIKNAGLYRFSVHKNGGLFICYINPGQTVVFGCSDTSTAAGIWNISGFGVQQIFDGNASEVLNAVDSRSISVAMLSATKAICGYINNATGFVEAIIVNYGSASGAKVVVNGESSKSVSIAAQTSSQATLIYKTNLGVTKGYVLDISGNAINPGAVATIDASGTSNGTSIDVLTSTKLICTYLDVGIKERVLDISSSAITPAAEVVPDGTTPLGGSIGTDKVKKISSSKAMVCFRVSAASPVILVRLQSVTGSTPAPTGTSLQIPVPGTAPQTDYGVAILSATRAIIAQALDRQYGDMMITLLDISGVTPIVLRNKLINLDLMSVANVDVAMLSNSSAYVSWTGGFSLGVDGMTIAITSDDQIITEQVAERLEPSVTASNGYLSCVALDTTHVMHLSRNASTFLSSKVVEIAV